MSRRSPAHALLPAGASWGRRGGMAIVARHAPAGPVWLADLSALGAWSLKGGGARAWLQTRGLPLPTDRFRLQPLGEDGFCARTGAAEYLLVDGPAGTAARLLGVPPRGLEHGARVLAREDLVAGLGGPEAAAVLAELCDLDPAAAAGRLNMIRIAGVDAWLAVHGEGAEAWLHLGCEPSYGAYLFETLLALAAERGGGLIGLHDFHGIARRGS